MGGGKPELSPALCEKKPLEGLKKTNKPGSGDMETSAIRLSRFRTLARGKKKRSGEAKLLLSLPPSLLPLTEDAFFRRSLRFYCRFFQLNPQPGRN